VYDAARQLGYDFSGVSAPENGKGLYGLAYAEMVVPLVKAVQELKAITVQQQQEIDLLKQQLRAKP
jgi:trimeric autotransporter adhesin